MDKKIRQIIFFIIVFGIIIFGNNCSYAGTQKINNLEYEVNLRENGNAEIIEHWDIYVSETNTLFKTFEIKDNIKYVDPKVEMIDSYGKVHEFEKIDELKYHVDKGKYYGLINENNQYEIAWGVGLDNESGNFRFNIKYVVENAVKKYNDCAEFYCQFLTDENSLESDNIYGNIVIDNNKDFDSLRVWAHGPINGEIRKTSPSKVEFHVNDMPANEMLEIRIATSPEIFNTDNNYNIYKMNEILYEEEEYADTANKARNRIEFLRIAAKICAFILMIVSFIMCIKYIIELIKINKEKNTLKYFRDIPDSKATPAEAAYLFYNSNYKFDQKLSKVFSATIMYLNLKKIIEFREIIDDKDVEIIVNELDDNDELTSVEKNVYNILYESAEWNSARKIRKTSINTIQKYFKENTKYVAERLDVFYAETGKIEKEKGNISDESKKQENMYLCSQAVYVILIFAVAFFTLKISPILSLLSVIILILNVFLCNVLVNKKHLTKKGLEEKNKWEGLYRYMTDFSLLRERELPEIKIWERFLVFATVFGISKKVLKQLKLAYPEIVYDYDYNIGTYLFINDSFNVSIEKTVINTISNYKSTISSESGFGGGFSSGGGGGFGGGSMGGR